MNKFTKTSKLQNVLSPLLEDTTLKKFRSYPVVYTGEIGLIRDYKKYILPIHKSQIDIIYSCEKLELYKYGVSTNIYRRITQEHKKDFKYFNLKIMRESHRYREVENLLTRELKAKKLLVNLVNKSVVRREIMYLPDEKCKDWYANLVDDLVTSRYKVKDFITYHDTW